MDTALSTPPCLVCGAKETSFWAQSWDVEYYSSDKSYQYFRCQKCDVLFIDPVPNNCLSEIYPPNYNSSLLKRSVISKIKLWLDGRLFQKLLKRLRAPSLTAIDIGGGYGLQLDELRRLDARIQSTSIVDIDKEPAKIVRDKGHDFYCGNIEDFQTETRFNLILALNLIEHVASPKALLNKLNQILADDGIVLLKTPNYQSLDAKLFRHLNWTGYHCPRHWVLFQRHNLEQLIIESGLEVSEFSYTQGAPFWTQSLLAWLAHRNWIKADSLHPINQHKLAPILNAFFAAFDFLRRPFSKTSQMFFVLNKRHQ